jgi:hypothetical protein
MLLAENINVESYISEIMCRSRDAGLPFERGAEKANARLAFLRYKLLRPAL